MNNIPLLLLALLSCIVVIYQEERIKDIQEECHDLAIMSVVNGHRMASAGHDEAFTVLSFLEMLATEKEVKDE